MTTPKRPFKCFGRETKFCRESGGSGIFLRNDIGDIAKWDIEQNLYQRSVKNREDLPYFREDIKLHIVLLKQFFFRVVSPRNI